jgi:AraC family transcriptional activator of mtrCDE
LRLFDLMRETVVLGFADSERMHGTFSALLQEQESSAPGRRAMMSALMRECLVLVLRRLCGVPECNLPWLSAAEDPRFAPVLSAILDAPENPHTLDSLAWAANMSRSAFAEQFMELFGRTPMAFVRDVRLRRAADLLRRTDLPVATIARQVGFSSRSHFSRAFRDQFGASPRQFRAEPTAAARP